jgi:hypothetical protein
MYKYLNMFFDEKNNIDQSDLIEHEIFQKSNENIYIKQFKIPDMYGEYLEDQAKEWLKMGIVLPTRN